MIYLIIAGACILIFIIGWLINGSSAKNTAKTTGVITDYVRSSKSYGGPSRNPSLPIDTINIRYTYQVDFKQYTQHKEILGGIPLLKVGDKVTVYYDKDNPYNSDIDAKEGLSILLELALIPIFFIAGLFCTALVVQVIGTIALKIFGFFKWIFYT